MKPESLKKDAMLAHWESIPANQPINPSMVPYKHEGSTYAEDGIRITGSREFIDSVLSRMKDLLEFEAIETRLQVVYKQSMNRENGLPMNGWNCYVQVHQRGREGAILQAYMAASRARVAQRELQNA